MRPCTDDELRALLEKLMKFIGKNVELLLHKAEEPHCFRVHKGRIYYVSEKLMRMATNFKGSDLLASDREDRRGHPVKVVQAEPGARRSNAAQYPAHVGCRKTLAAVEQDHKLEREERVGERAR